MRTPVTIYKLIFLMTCTSALLFSSCKKGGNIGIKPDDEVFANTIDTVKVVASTYLLDSLPTSNSGVMLLGQLNDQDFGKLSVSSYLQLVPPSLSKESIPKNARFDSLTLVLKYNKYYYGDTTLQQNIVVHRLTEDMVLRKIPGSTEEEEKPVFVNVAALYSTSSFKHEITPLGSSLVKFKPQSPDSMIVKLDNKLGQEFFDLISQNDRRFTNTDEFLTYFKGIVISSTQGKSIAGFKADQIKIYLNYSYPDQGGFPKKEKIIFKEKSNDYQFNHIDIDRSQTKLSLLNPKQKELASALTDQQLFLQGGTGLVTKLKMPGLINFMNEPNIVVNKAELIIETLPSYYSVFEAPKELLLFVANSLNTPKSILQKSYEKADQLAQFEPAVGIGATGKYRFLLTEYSSQLKKGNLKNTSLLLSLPVNQLLHSINRAQFGTNKTTVSAKLIITYTKY